nr:hypothetical protein [Tanacetum cinerariifolium]
DAQDKEDYEKLGTSDKLRVEAQAENEIFLNKLDENIQKIIKEQVKKQVKVQVFKILPKIKKTINEQLKAEVLTHASSPSKKSYVVAADLSKLELKKILIKKMERNKSIYRHRNDEDKDEEPFAGSDQGSKRRRAEKEPESTSAPKEKASKTSGKSAEGSKSQQKTTGITLKDHDLLKPLPLIPNSRGHHVIPFDHFINNDLEYLCGSASSRKYTTSVTKTMAEDYGHIKDDDKLYNFKEGDLKRLHIQDIEDTLLLLVQGKLTNLTEKNALLSTSL